MIFGLIRGEMSNFPFFVVLMVQRVPVRQMVLLIQEVVSMVVLMDYYTGIL